VTARKLPHRYARIQQAAASGDSIRAEKLARRLTERRPNDPGTWETYAKVQQLERRYADAEQTLRRGIGRTGSLVLRLHLAEVVMAQDCYDEAGDILHRML
jgi:predicted Zn-dependent protease